MQKTRDLPPWFAPLLARATAIAGSASRLAQAIGVGQATLSAWHEGSLPSLDKFARLVEYVGGDITQSLPQALRPPAGNLGGGNIVAEDMALYGGTTPLILPIHGVVESSTSVRFPTGTTPLSAPFRNVERVSYPDLDTYFSGSEYRPETRGAVGIYLEVARGASAEIGLPAGSLLACALPQAQGVRAGTPVLVERFGESEGEPSAYLIRLAYPLRERPIDGDATVMLMPLSGNRKPEVYSVAAIRILAVILGSITRWGEAK